MLCQTPVRPLYFSTGPPALVKAFRTYVCLEYRFVIGLYRSRVPYAWHSWLEEHAKRDDGKAGHGTATAHSGGHSDLYCRARLSALGPRNRRAGRSLLIFDDTRSPEGARTSRPDLARSDQAARSSVGKHAGSCRRSG